jgi:hypothetical protein
MHTEEENIEKRQNVETSDAHWLEGTNLPQRISWQTVRFIIGIRRLC